MVISQGLGKPDPNLDLLVKYFNLDRGKILLGINEDCHSVHIDYLRAVFSCVGLSCQCVRCYHWTSRSAWYRYCCEMPLRSDAFCYDSNISRMLETEYSCKIFYGYTDDSSYRVLVTSGPMFLSKNYIQGLLINFIYYFEY